jgi:hypothetical protein
MFEPFQSELVDDFRQFEYFHYMRPGVPNRQLYAYCERVFSGAIRHPWIDREVHCLRPRFRVIKEIRANLFLKWINESFPEVPLLLLIRHPCAVVLSRMQLNWRTDEDIAAFLVQSDLVNDFLRDKLDVIRKATTEEEKHAVIWCISNLVPLQQFSQHDLNVVFYEHLCLRPETELPRVFQLIGQDYDAESLRHMDRPSSTSQQTSAVVSGEDKVSHWTKHLTTSQTDRILAVVEKFGLSHLYGDSLTPMVGQ